MSNNSRKTMEKFWLKSYQEGVPAEIDWTQYRSLTHLLEEAFRKYADRKAYVCMDKSMTYGELDAMSQRMGAWLQSRGIEQGARVAIMLPNVLQYPVAMTAALRAGYTIVNVNPLYTPRELQHQLIDSGAEAIIVLENFATTLEQVIDKTAIKHVVVASMGDLLGGLKGMIVNLVVRKVKKLVPAFSLPTAISFNKMLAEGARMTLKPVKLGHDDIAFLQYTGGTTGVSKGAVLLHRNVIANVLQNEAWLAPTLATGPQDEQLQFMCALPLYHIYALTVCALMATRHGRLRQGTGQVPHQHFPGREHALQRPAQQSRLRRARFFELPRLQRRRHGRAEGRGRPLAQADRLPDRRRLWLVGDLARGHRQPLRHQRLHRHHRLAAAVDRDRHPRR
jgi:long-chain acyl-CoA synthetase